MKKNNTRMPLPSLSVENNNQNEITFPMPPRVNQDRSMEHIDMLQDIANLMTGLSGKPYPSSRKKQENPEITAAAEQAIEHNIHLLYSAYASNPAKKGDALSSSQADKENQAPSQSQNPKTTMIRAERKGRGKRYKENKKEWLGKRRPKKPRIGNANEEKEAAPSYTP